MTAPVIIVGAGIAGLWTALELAPHPVTLLTGAPLGTGAATGWAQGGIAVSAGDSDSIHSHTKDTLAAGADLCDPAAARTLAADIEPQVRALQTLGVPFDLDGQGALSLGLEAAHSHARIAHISGDQAGAEILATLVRAVRKSAHIDIREGWRAVALLPDATGGCAGVLARNHNGIVQDILASRTVLATGGFGGIFADTTSPPGAIGSAVAMAHRLGAEIANPEFVQFHPTAIRTGADPLPLATEALRGAGASLVNKNGQPITDDDLGPRDKVARAVHRAARSDDGAWLDCREAVGDRFPEAFPGVFAACMAAGIDPRTTPIPIAPAAHYTMGGIATDLEGRTSVDGLWAVGECACNGLHGANRLASNSLAEGLVFGHRAAAALAAAPVRRVRPGRAEIPPALPPIVLQGLRLAMSQLAGVERNAYELQDLLARIDRLTRRFGESDAILTARLIAGAALDRRESRGSHFRTDYPDRLPNARNTIIRQTNPQELVAAE
ncbi:L-aspartate oxidase [Hyphobacterium sp. HN65]|uniref:L-aspartate oxidase n=1 Tax=Hyphobacterium lacteum TaxID=3116575 RepID=A0ABU7LMV7_9PROT|nr:L-aspartate oxidase [Hyphobacterium sp. HN65]MEE2525258.1 L-aspartate oxidase [Hyphobacterium sp. HN65]